MLYQPYDYKVGENGLGTKEGLTELCTEAHQYGADALVAYGPNGELEDYYYSREVVVLRYFLREHRDKIADLESRIAELESALL